MSNNDSNNNNAKNEKKSIKNDAVTAVEVVKDDTVVYEDGDFENYNADKDYEVNTDSEKSDKKNDKSEKPSKEEKDDKSEKDSKSKKEDKSSKDEKSDKEDKSDKKEKASKKDKSSEEDKSGITMAGIYQWASKLKDDFKSEAADMTHDVTEKAAAMTLGKLVDAVDFELAAFDKSLEVAKNLVATAEEQREKIASKKEKYQGMIDKLDK
ncbi:hypothetical protein KPY62_08030 [Psychrobacter sp. TAE2020]|uniref:hypothetical protein n=1 Tax=Psychrobacter sp. TAE2020 TaxID=2846762 RepID=UPI001C0FA3A6|nr:hypothetical protein [Psychrobacter sp. TAE2020]MBU5617037.1 hypothetical protein [Psychrobacter sp. TAE2020]